jgi:SAM-dependent methyltransferase
VKSPKVTRRSKPPEAPEVAPSRAGLELVWPGKYDAAGRRCPVPRVSPRMDLVEAYGEAHGEAGAPDRLIVGDNLLALDALVEQEAGTVDLAVVDPPFGTGGRFEVQTRVGGKGEDGKAAILRRPAYGDRWPGGAAGLVAMLDPRLRLLHALLAPTGSLYVHLDPTVVHAVKLLLDEIFGPECFQRQIVWRIGWISGFKSRAHNWIRNHDVILFYTKHPTDFRFNKTYVPHPPEYRRRDGNPARAPGMPISDVWNASDVEAALEGEASLDSIQIKSFSGEKTGYATQKNESVLRRIVEASSQPGDLVADVFCGSGTTLAVARKLGRRVLGCDSGQAAIHITRRRMLGIESARGLQVWSLQDHEATSSSRIEVALEGLEGGELGVRLHGLHDPSPIPELAALDPSPLDLVDAWAVEWQAKDAVLRPDLWLPRHHDRRVLEVVAGPHAYLGPGPWRLRIAVFDVLHRRTTLEIELAREGRGLAVVDRVSR